LKVNSAQCSNAALVEGADQGPGPRTGPDQTVAVAIALAVLRGYKLVLSPLFTGSCRFHPSCSDYAAEAIRRYGLTRGSWLAVRRLGRCHPFCAGGYDPVPPRN
jgi:putative membrane protein insertion efficiency factor